MAFSTSWLARPPTAAASGGRVPLAVRDRQRTNSAFKEAWKEDRAAREQDFKKQPVCLVKVKKKKYKNVGVNKKIRQTLLTLFLRVELTSSVSFSKSSASFKHLDVSNTA